jgi:uncharacterized protein
MNKQTEIILNSKLVQDGCMITFSGILIDLWHPDKKLINIQDIAHGLANNSRWNGHSRKFWSVAQHCCMMYDIAPKERKLTFLMHDAEEAYWSDVIKPIKNKLQESCPEIIELMHLMRDIIFERYGIEKESRDSKHADAECLFWEYENIIKSGDIVKYWSPAKAKREFLKRFYSEFENTGFKKWFIKKIL